MWLSDRHNYHRHRIKSNETSKRLDYLEIGFYCSSVTIKTRITLWRSELFVPAALIFRVRPETHIFTTLFYFSSLVMRIEGANIPETIKGGRKNAIESTEGNETRKFMARKNVKRKLVLVLSFFTLPKPNSAWFRNLLN